MDDSLNNGNENKLPLFVGIGAVAVAILALLFAFKARSEAAALNEKLAGFDPSAVATKAELSSVSNSSAKIGDIQVVEQKVDQMKSAFLGSVETLANSVSEQQKIISALAKGGSAKSATDKSAPARTAGAGEHAVKKGETFRKIATGAGVSLEELSKANPGVDSSKLKIGQIIKLPAKK